MDTFKDIPVFRFETLEDWKAWLGEQSRTCKAVWIMLAKKGTAGKSITYEDARDYAIAYGWIDGQVNRWDDEYYITRFTPRSAKSNWSKINCAVAELLIERGEMTEAGLEQVEAAKKDGRWERAYHSSSAIAVPDDFRAALESSSAANELFSRLNSANRYAFLYRIQTASNAALRSKRIEKYIEMLENGDVFHPPPG